MKKQHPAVAAVTAVMLAVILSVTAMAVSIPSPSKSIYVHDEANILSDDTESYIIAKNEKLYEKAEGSQIVVVTVNTTDGVEIREYADTIFSQWSIGDPEEKNGLLLLLAVEDDNYWVTQGGGIQNSLTSVKIKNLLDNYLEPYFVTGEYDRGVSTVFSKFVSSYEKMYSIDLEDTETGDPNKQEANAGGSTASTIVITVLVVLLLVAFIAFIIYINRRMKKKAREKERRERAAMAKAQRKPSPSLGTTYLPTGAVSRSRAKSNGGAKRTGGNRSGGRR